MGQLLLRDSPPALVETFPVLLGILAATVHICVSFSFKLMQGSVQSNVHVPVEGHRVILRKGVKNLTDSLRDLDAFVCPSALRFQVFFEPVTLDAKLVYFVLFLSDRVLCGYVFFA